MTLNNAITITTTIHFTYLSSVLRIIYFHMGNRVAVFDERNVNDYVCG